MTHDCLKTIAGFLNTDGGGNLYIGVSDNGEFLGLNHDKYKNLTASELGNKYIGFWTETGYGRGD